MAKPKDAETPADPVVKTPHVMLAVASITAKMAKSGIEKSKGKEAGGVSYKFRKVDDVFNSLASEYVADKVIVLPSYANRVATEYQSKSGGRMVSVTVEGTYRIVSLVDGSELVSGPFIGEGMDSGDKATNKAMSISYKYFAGQTFCIPFVGADDPDEERPEVQPRAVARAQQLDPTTDKVGKDGERVTVPENETLEQAINRLATSKEGRKKLAGVITKAYDIVLIDNLPDDKVAEAIQRLEKYVALAKKK